MKPYPDTNLFTWVYLEFPGSDEADQLMKQARNEDVAPLPVTWLHRVEAVNAFEFCVWLGRQPSHPTVTSQQASAALAIFREDLALGHFLRPARLSEAVLESQAEELALRHTARHGFRTYDLLHVASALLLGCDTFWSFDERTLKLAKLEGLKVPVGRRR